MKKTFEYIAKGIVLGDLWGGGVATYRSKDYQNNDKDKLIATIENALKDGSLDSGMGFEELCGAIMTITTIKTIKIEGETFKNIEFEDIIFDENLSKEEATSLWEIYLR